MTDSASTTSISGRALTTWIVIGVGLGFAAFLASLAVLDGKDPDPGDVVKALPAVAALVALSRAVDVILQLVGSKASKRHEKLQAQAYDEVRELYRHCWNGALLSYTLAVTAWLASGEWWAVGVLVIVIFVLGSGTAWAIAHGQQKRDEPTRATAVTKWSPTVRYPKSNAATTHVQPSP